MSDRRRFFASSLSLAFLLLFLVPCLAEDVPAFQYIFGQPAIESMDDYDINGWTGYVVAPPIAASDSRVYIGGRHIKIFSTDGGLSEMWPFPANPESYSQVHDIALGPEGDVWGLAKDWARVHHYDQSGEFVDSWGYRGDTRYFYEPTAIAVAPDSTVVVLDGGTGIVKRYTESGDLLAYWYTVAAPDGYWARAVDMAAGASGVWVTTEVFELPGTGYSEVWLDRYTISGEELGSWDLGEGFRAGVEVDSEGNAWVSLRIGDVPHLLRLDPDGAVLTDLILDAWPDRFAVGPDSTLWLLVAQTLVVPGYHGYDYASYHVECRDFSGSLLGAWGDFDDMAARGSLAYTGQIAVTPDGDTYWAEHFDQGHYLAHYGPDGAFIESDRDTDFDGYPVYDPSSGTIESGDWSETRDADGNRYVCWADIGYYQPGQCELYIQRTPKDGGEPEEFRIPVVATAQEPELYTDWSYVFGPDSNLHVAVSLYSVVDPETRLLWVGTISTNGALRRAWTIEDPPWPDWSWLGGFAVDGALNVYIAVDSSHARSQLQKYSSSGAGAQSIDGGPTLHDVSDMKFDDSGTLRVVDSASNFIHVFAFTPAPFPDVPYWYWAKDAVRAAVAAGIVTGYEDGLYRPTQAVTRDQMAVYIARAEAGGQEGVPAGPAEPSFSDVPVDQWAYDSIEYCASWDIVQGYEDGTYDPTARVDRAQMAVYIARSVVTPTGDEGLADYDPGEYQAFPDVAMDHWAYRHITYLSDQGMVQGYADGTYKPSATVTRDQMAVYIQRAFHL